MADPVDEFAKRVGEAQEALTRKALSEPDFRARLLADPRAAIAELNGVQLPEDVRVVVHENAPNLLNLVLPGTVPAEDKLTDEELEAVAGGTGWVRPCSIFWMYAPLNWPRV